MFKLENINVPIVGLIENMAWFTPEELPNNKYYIFGRDGAKNLAEGMGETFLGHIPLVQSLRESGDVGRPAVFQDNTITSDAFIELTHKFVEEVHALSVKKAAKSLIKEH
jgi:ATP-binding protein involved in chromosome partitioning